VKEVEANNSSGARGSRPALPVLTWLRLARTFQKIDQLATEHLRAWGLSTSHFDLLVQVGVAEGLTQQDVAEALLVTKGNICQLVDRMERDGLIRRLQAGRSNQLFLTDKGRSLYNEVVPDHEVEIERIISVLNPSEQRQLFSLLRTLERSLTGFPSKGESK
jgi:DNA-binding MarR family transcriptional regulator